MTNLLCAYVNENSRFLYSRLRTFFATVSVVIISLNTHAQISGASSVCISDSTALTGAPSGGTWSSSSTGIATIGSSSGHVTGVTGGTVTISYSTGGSPATISFTVNPLPTVFLVSGGGSYCAGSSGLHVGLASSTTGIQYQLYLGGTALGSPLPGTSSALDFGPQTASGTYTVVATNMATGCVRNMAGSAVITINPVPSPISGPTAYCPGGTGTLSSAPTGGVWVSSTTSVATVGSSSGLLSAITTGTTTVTYTLPATGCAATAIVTVSAATGTITTPASVCTGATATLTNSVPGGTWSSSTTSIATIGSLTGVLAGVSSGIATIAYSLGTLGCTVTTTLSVVTGPASISGATYACVGATTTVSDGTSGGTWSSSATSVATVSGTSGTGVIYGVSPGVAIISYTDVGCARTVTITVNPNPAPLAGVQLCTGNSTVLTDAVGGGLWTTLSSNITIGSSSGYVTAITPGTASIDYSIGGCFILTTVTVIPVPGAISLPTAVCVGSTALATDVIGPGVWSSSSTGHATIGSSSGIITGITSGTVIISYTTACTVAAPIVINATPSITGTPVACVGQTTHLTSTSFGGTWSSSDTSVATINTSGLVTGIRPGVATIGYVLSTGCNTSVVVTINALPTAIFGPSSMCVGLAITLTDTSLSGTWSSSNPAVGSVDVTGDVTGVSYGFATITYAYTTTTGCYVTKPVTVNSSVTAISGLANVCLGSTISLTDPTTGGTWSSSAPAIGTVSSLGVVTGITLGSTTISYTLGTTCYTTSLITVIRPPLHITGADSICTGATTLFVDASGGGTWTSGPPLIASIGSSSGVVYGATSGSAVITYTTAPGCFASRTITINSLPGGITGVFDGCPGTTTTLSDIISGGIWTSSDTSVASIDSFSGFVTANNPGVAIMYYTLPTGCSVSSIFTVIAGPLPITGYSDLCIGTSASFIDASFGGVWSSSAPSVAPVNPAGSVSGVAIGTSTITYTIGSICYVTYPVTVTTLPTAITGSPYACPGVATILREGVLGGVWSSGNTAIATVGSSSGAVTGVSAGAVTILYTIGPACTVTQSMTVNPQPLPITGPDSVCLLQTVGLSDATPAGVWSSSSPTIGSVDAFGNVTGILPGVTTILYTNSLGCPYPYPVTVNITPTPIIGSPVACIGSTYTLSDGVGGGNWSSANPLVAVIGSSSGTVTTVALGTTGISYTMPVTGCFAAIDLSVDPLPTLYVVTGGGYRCSGDRGLHIGLSGSAVGYNYFLYLGSTASGPFAGTGSALDFGLETLPGTYIVTGTNTSTGCNATMAGTAVITITPSIPASVGIRLSTRDTICAGAAVIYTPVPVNGGTHPAYQWKVNSIPVSLGSTYTYIPANGDVVAVNMVSDAVCPSPDTSKDSVTMIVWTFQRPHVSIAATPGDTVCQGTNVTLHPVPVYGGASPTYEWLRNGTPRFGGSTYSFVPVDGDIMYCIITSDYLCLLSGVDTSAPLIMKVDTPVVPFVFIGAVPGSTIGKGLEDTLTVYAAGAVSPTYQWYLGDLALAGATTNTYISTYGSVTNDSISCVVASYGVCPITSFTSIFISVISGVNQLSITDDISVQPNPNKGDFIIKGTLSTASGDVAIEITDMLGRVVYQNSVLVKNGRLNEEIQTGSTLPGGTYILSLRAGGQSQVFHIVIE